MTINYPTPLEPVGIDANGMGTLLFVPAVADVNAPTLAEINAGINISCALYNWNPSGEQSKTERVRYCSRGVNEQLGKTKYQADPIQYDYDPQDPASDEYPAYAALASDTKGFIVDRRGIDYAEPTAAGQFVDIYPVQVGVRNRVQIDARNEGEKLRVEQTVAIISDPAFDVAIAA